MLSLHMHEGLGLDFLIYFLVKFLSITGQYYTLLIITAPK